MTDAIQEQAAMELAWRTEAKAGDLKPEDRALIERLFGPQWLKSGQGTVTLGGLSLLLEAARAEGLRSPSGGGEQQQRPRLDMQARRMTRCQADCDGECEWFSCPQLRDNEPHATGRHCPLDRHEWEDA